MKKNGLRTAIIFLIIGLSLGFGLKALERYLANEIADVLRDEIKSACPTCRFEYDDMYIILPGMRGVATNARVILDDKDRLVVKELRASFGISQILQRTITLHSLDFYDAFADQVNPDSITYKIIDGFSTSNPDPNAAPPLLKVKLMNLTVHSGKFKQKFGSGDLLGRDVTLKLKREDEGLMVLRPDVGEVLYKGRGIRETYNLGPAKAQLAIRPDSIRVINFFIGDKNSFAETNNFTYFDIDDSITGDLHLQLEKNLRVFAPLENDILLGDIAFSGKIQDPTALLQLHSKKSNQLQSSLPVKLEHNQLSGELRLLEKNIYFEGLEATGNAATIKITGTTGSPVFDVQGTTEEVFYEGISLGAPMSHTTHVEDLIEFDVRQIVSGQKTLTTSGVVEGTDAGLVVQSAIFELANLELSPRTDKTKNKINRFFMSGRGTLSGPLTPEQLSGESTLVLKSQSFAGNASVSGTARLRDGKLESTVANTSNTFSAELTANFLGNAKSKLKVALNDFKPADYDPKLECFIASASGEYLFDIKELSAGSGQLEIKKIIAGCEPEQTRLVKPVTVPIRHGIFTLPAVQFQGLNTSVTARGNISLTDGYDVSLTGSMYLASLLPLVPGIDELSGKLNTTVLLQGELDAPQLEGTATLENGRASIESTGISIEDATAKIELRNGEIAIQEGTGKINGGDAKLSGTFYPGTDRLSSLSLIFDNVVHDPLQDAVLTLSGDLNLELRRNEDPRLFGEIEVEGAQIERNFDLLTMLEDLPSLLLGTSKPSEDSSKKSARDRPAIRLDISVFATRNIFILTNLLSAELKGDFRITGTAERPLINGTLNTLNGWFGLKERRFDITSAQINFAPSFPQPSIELLGETYVRSRVGDNVLILLEAEGPVLTPTITLSSDRGLSQRELLTLLSSGSDLATGGVNSRTEDLELEDRLREGGSFLERTSRFLRKITRIDSLSLEPRINTRRGQLEPTLLAEKKVMEYLSLVGQSFISSGGDQSVVSLQYDLTEKLQLAGSVSTITSENTNALGIDLKYTILARENPYIEYTLKGNEFLNRRELLRRLKLTSGSQLKKKDIDRIKKSLLSLYRRNGFFRTQSTVECLLLENNCRHLSIEIKEGPRSKIGKFEFRGDPLPDNFEKELRQLLEEHYATTLTIDDGTEALTRWLRSEGYIGARVQLAYEESDANKKTLQIDVTTGDPVSFEFVGNTLFSPEDFLETINLFKRKQPFGNNTIRILIENMERMYREAGYLSVSIQQTSYEDTLNKRIYYRIDIEENEKVQIRDIVFHSEAFTEEQIKELVRQSAYENYYDQIFAPEAIVKEQLERNARILRSLLHYEGYNKSIVKADFTLQQEANEAIIEYTILENTLIAIQELEVLNFPEEISLPEKPLPPLSVPKVNGYVLEVVNLLSENGYFGHSVSTEIEGDYSKFIISVTAPQQTHIRDILVIGNGSVPTEVIREHLSMKNGEALRSEDIQKSRRALLKLGLFSRVDIEKVSSDQKENSLLVRVVERPLTTLEVGTGVNSEFGYHVFGETIDKSLFTDGRRLSLRLDAYYDQSESQVSRGIASLGYFDPEFFEKFSFAQDLRYQKLDLTTLEYDLDRYSLSTSLNENSNEVFTYNFTHTILRDDLSNVSPGAVIGAYDTGVVDLSFLTFSMAYDKRDQVLNPRKGYFAQIESIVASELIASEANYTSLQGQFSYIAPFRVGQHAFALAQNMRGGASWTLQDTDEIPITQRYYLGGRTTIRGFRENSLGPRGDDGAVIGGDVLLQNNLEVRYYPDDVLSLHLFFDAGNVFLQDRAIEIDELRKSVGTGLRYLSPIGPIGFDIGKPLNEKEGEPSIRFHFVVGTTF